MPLPEFHSAMRAKFDSTHSLSDLPFSTPDDEFMELLWENGQIVMQGQSSRSKKNTSPAAFASQSIKVPGKEERYAVAPRIGRFGAADFITDDFSVARVSDHTSSNAQDDEMAPWLNLPIDDYYSEFLSEFSAPNVNSPTNNDSPLPTDRGKNGLGQLVIDSHDADAHVLPKAPSGSSDPGGIRSGHLSQMAQQWPSSSLGNKSRELDLAAGSTGIMSLNTNWDDKLNNGKVQKQGLLFSEQTALMNSSAGLMNFSHFSRPIALVKAKLESAERLKCNDNASTGGNSNRLESTLINTASGMKSISQGKMHQIPSENDCKLDSTIPQEVASIHSDAIDRENDSGKHDSTSSNKNIRAADPTHNHNLSFKITLPIAGREVEKALEPAVASSSVCSGNGAGTISNDTKYTMKRKSQEGDESGYRSEQDPEDESTGVKKLGTGRGSSAKRGRAAEVHNLSERRRRDRINEKMRALQELIPNCNKVDKASMLDEAIEYLKTLQLQIQIMSTGSGLCIPPIMLPARMQHMRASQMAHFPSVGVGMGMGYGMGMLDVNGSPLIPVHPMHGAQFPCSSTAGTLGVPGMPNSTTNLRMFGIPSQGIPWSMPRGPRLSPVPVQSTRMNTVPEISRATTPSVQVSEATILADSEEKKQGSNLETGLNTGASASQFQTATEHSRECYEESFSELVKNHTSNSSDGKGNSSTGTASCG